jgi:CheY-like chemotaxis protein
MLKKVLVIDDDEDILSLFKWVLEDAGYEVAAYSEPPELEDVCERDPHVIITDEWLPDKKGHQFCKEVKANTATRHIPVILVSAFSNIGAIAKRAKANHYVSKPFDIEDLVTAVKQYA